MFGRIEQHLVYQNRFITLVGCREQLYIPKIRTLLKVLKNNNCVHLPEIRGKNVRILFSYLLTKRKRALQTNLKSHAG